MPRVPKGTRTPDQPTSLEVRVANLEELEKRVATLETGLTERVSDLESQMYELEEFKKKLEKEDIF